MGSRPLEVTNIDTSDRLLSKGTSVATAYSVTNFGLPSRNREKGQTETTGYKQARAGKERAPVVNLSDANIGQTSPTEKGRILDLREQYVDNFKVVYACEGPSIIMELKDPTCSPYVAHPRSFTLEHQQRIQEDVSKLPRHVQGRDDSAAPQCLCLGLPHGTNKGWYSSCGATFLRAQCTSQGTERRVR